MIGEASQVIEGHRGGIISIWPAGMVLRRADPDIPSTIPHDEVEPPHSLDKGGHLLGDLLRGQHHRLLPLEAIKVN